MKRFGIIILLFRAAAAFGAPVTKSDLLINLKPGAEIEIKESFTVTSMYSRSGTGKISGIKIVDIDLVGANPEAVVSREQNANVISQLKQLTHFKSLKRVFCFVDFNAKVFDDYIVPAGTRFRFSKPQIYGTPSKKFTKTGATIELYSYADKSISANFEGEVLRRLYCSFNADEDQRYNAEYLDDLRISHLTALLAPAFKLRY